MNTFDNFNLIGANISRYVLIRSDAKKMVSAYRKLSATIEAGQIPLFLLDGKPTSKLLDKAITALKLKFFLALYRPVDSSLKKRCEELQKQCISRGYINRDDVTQAWCKEEPNIECLTEYRTLQNEYNKMSLTPPTDALTEHIISEDVNEYLYNNAKGTFPLGIESILKANEKQSAIPKLVYFVNGFENISLPKESKCNQRGMQISIFDIEKTCVEDSADELRKYLRESISQNGGIKLMDIVKFCTEMGLYKCSITLYIIGLALKEVVTESTYFSDEHICSECKGTDDMGMRFARVYDALQPWWIGEKLTRTHKWEYKAVVFIDNTQLKDKMRDMFELKPIDNKNFDTLGMAIVQANKWISDNLRYPVAFLDDTLHQILSGSVTIYGNELQKYDEHFTIEKCKQLKSQLPSADFIALAETKKVIGYEPEKLPLGHFGSVLYSKEFFIDTLLRKSRVVI